MEGGASAVGRSGLLWRQEENGFHRPPPSFAAEGGRGPKQQPKGIFNGRGALGGGEVVAIETKLV